MAHNLKVGDIEVENIDDSEMVKDLVYNYLIELIDDDSLDFEIKELV